MKMSIDNKMPNGLSLSLFSLQYNGPIKVNQKVAIAEKTEIDIWSESQVWNPNKCLGPDPKMKNLI